VHSCDVQAIDFAPQRSTTGRNSLKQKCSIPCKQLSTKQKNLCKRMFLIFNGNVQKVAAAVRAPTAVVAEFVASSNMQLPQRKGLKKKSHTLKTAKYTSMRHYNQSWLSIINQKGDRPWCVPCSHTEICSEKNCSCLQNGFFCTRACAHSEYSPNFYRGCDCKGNCNANTCSCFHANRECDPELCTTCGACTDPPNTIEKVNQRCHNDNMSMRRHRRLLISKSTLPGAGWGLFCKDPLKKGDFIHEYLGELITIEEGERRGALYDHAHRSYLFNQSTDNDIDAWLKGNKTRFGNHSETPNVDKRAMYVNGNRRIGFFANQNIPAQSEVSSV
jgi:[histone H3]-lysine27 N-trimethyltransferase EZH2